MFNFSTPLYRRLNNLYNKMKELSGTYGEFVEPFHCDIQTAQNEVHVCMWKLGNEIKLIYRVIADTIFEITCTPRHTDVLPILDEENMTASKIDLALYELASQLDQEIQKRKTVWQTHLSQVDMLQNGATANMQKLFMQE